MCTVEVKVSVKQSELELIKGATATLLNASVAVREQVLQAVFENEVGLLANYTEFSLLPYAHDCAGAVDITESVVEVGKFGVSEQLAIKLFTIEKAYCGISHGVDTISQLVQLSLMGICKNILQHKTDATLESMLGFKRLSGVNETSQFKDDSYTERKFDFYGACGAFGVALEDKKALSDFVAKGRRAYLPEQVGVLKNRKDMQLILLDRVSAKFLESRHCASELLDSFPDMVNMELVHLLSNRV